MVRGSAKLENGATGLPSVFLPLMDASPTRTLCVYDDETATVGGSKLLRGSSGVDGCHAILSVLRSVQAKLCFPKRDVHNGLLLALSKVKLAVWKSMEPRQCADWADTHTKRIRNLCRAVAQGELRSPSAERTRALPWRRRVDHDHDNNIDGSGGVIRIMFRAIITASSLESCGHDAQRQRRLDGRKCRCRLRPHMVEAEWADGHRKAISVLHVGRTQHLQRQQTTSKFPHEPIWQSTMMTTGHTVRHEFRDFVFA